MSVCDLALLIALLEALAKLGSIACITARCVSVNMSDKVSWHQQVIQIIACKRVLMVPNITQRDLIQGLAISVQGHNILDWPRISSASHKAARD